MKHFTFIILGLVVCGAAIGGVAFFARGGKGISDHSFTVVGSGGEAPLSRSEDEGKVQEPTSGISGIACADYIRRPFAIMLASDHEARPLSGIASADMVFEMPVVSGGITRLMAVFQCTLPEEIGSIRSSRHDFIPLAQGLDAIFVHWGGSHYALDILAKGVIQNIDALRDPYSSFYRKNTARPPHNGFTNRERLVVSSEKLGYRLETEFEGYPHIVSPYERCEEGGTHAVCKKGTLEIKYPSPHYVKYEYNPVTRTYARFRGGTKEVDRLSGVHVEASTVVVMRARSRQIEGQYNDVEIEGTGEAMVYRYGEEIKGTWKKEKTPGTSKLFFLDGEGKEIAFAPGMTWINVAEPNQAVTWTVGP